MKQKSKTSRHLVRLVSVGSTNDFLREQLESKNVQEGTLIWAEEQFAGHGQEGNQWYSEAGKNLTFSMLFRPESIKPSDQFLLNKMVSLGVMDYLKSKNLGQVRHWIKWPNDIYLDDKKAGGILLLNSVNGAKIEYCIAGLGLNVNQTAFPSGCGNPVSMKLCTGIGYELQEEIILLSKAILDRYERLKNGDSRLDADYLDHLYHLGKKASYVYQGRLVEATITGVDGYGRLLLIDDRQSQLCCDIREIKFLPG